MKFGDVFKIALHNLWHNKSRTILTVIIVAIVSSLIMALCLLGIAFIQNQVDVSKIVFEAEGTEYRAVRRSDYAGNKNYKDKPYTQTEIAHIDASVEEFKHVVDTVMYRIEEKNIAVSNNSYRSWQYYAYNGSSDSFPTEGTFREIEQVITRNGQYFNLYSSRFVDFGMYNLFREGLIKEGRIWSSADRNTANVWLGSSYVRTLEKSGISLGLGDTVTLCALLSQDNFNSDTSQCELRVSEFKVCGIFDSDLMKTNSWDNIPNIIADGKFFMGKFTDACTVTDVEMTYRPPQTDYDYNAVYDDMEAFTERVNEGIETYHYSDQKEISPFECSYVEEMRMTVLMGTIIMAVVAILALLILLLSVGSVANTIIISVDKNRKFIGLMKAMGLNQKGVKKIVTCESLLQIILGVLIGVAVLFILQPVVLSLMESMFASMFSFFEVEYTITVSVPFYLPLITALLFFLFASLFSRGSLGKIARQDVISTISEVA